MSSVNVPIDPNSRRWTESYKEKLIRKTKENPFVPIGTLITTGALIMASFKLRQRDSKKFQVWLRYRVAFQTFTILAILGGLYKYGQGNLEENQRVMERINQQKAEVRLAEERAELEKRIADAAKAQEEEEEAQLVKKSDGAGTSSEILSMVSWGKRSAEKSNAELPEQPAAQALPPVSPPSSPSHSSWNPLSWWRKSSSSSSEQPSQKDS